MKSLKSKVILSAIVLLFALVATIGSTYAWFTVSSTVEVPGITMNVKSSKSLLIRPYYSDSAEVGSGYLEVPANYYTTLTEAQIITIPAADVAFGTYTSPYANIGTWRMDNATAISTLTMPTVPGTGFEAGALNGTDLQALDLDAKTISDVSGGNSASGFYIDLEFWLFSQLTAENIVLQDLVISTTSGTDIDEAIAVSVFVSGAVAAPIYSLDPDYAFVFTTGMTGYDGNDSDFLDTTDMATLLASHALYYNSGSASNLTNVNVGTVTGLAGATIITQLAADTPTRIVVRIFIEGWDADTTNTILASDLDISFKFALQDQ